LRTDSPRLVTLVSGGLELAVWEWSGNGPPLLFFHATGFHGRCWDQVIRRLPGRRAFAFDLRGHGRSSKPEPPYSWMPFASDSAALAQHLGIRGGLAVGHSMGGHTALAVAIERPAAVAALVLLDPTVFPCSWYGHPSHDVSYIRKRRAAFRSPEEMFERFRSRPPFVTWDPLVLRDYCEGGLLPDGCGGFVLACPPPVEASLYENCLGAESNLHPFLDAVKAPVTVLRAGGFWTAAGTFSLTASPTDPDLVSKFPRARDVLLAGRDHYFPLESPDLVSTEIERSLAAHF
jgi:lipase